MPHFHYSILLVSSTWERGLEGGRGSAILTELQAIQDQGLNFALGFQRWRRVGLVRRARALISLRMLNLRELANLKLAQLAYNINKHNEPAFMAEVLCSSAQSAEGRITRSQARGDYRQTSDNTPVGGQRTCQTSVSSALKVWNSLPGHIHNARTPAIFKVMVTRHIIQIRSDS